MTSLVDFLLARIAEDEARAQIEPGWIAPYDEPLRWSITDSGEPDMLVVSPARVLAECEAKRRIVEEVYPALEMEFGGAYRGEPSALLLRLLALPYADHPEYDESWRP